MTVYAVLRYNSLGVFAGLRSLHVTVESALASDPGEWEPNSSGVWQDAKRGRIVQLYTLSGEYGEAVKDLALAVLRGDPMASDAVRDVLRC